MTVADEGLGLARGGAWSLAGQGLGLVAALVTTPFIVRQLGPARYGIWVVVFTAFRYVWLAEFGLSSASTHFGADAVRRGDAEREADVVSASLVLILLTTGLATIIVWAFSSEIVGWLAIHGSEAHAAVWAMRLMAASAIGGGLVLVAVTPLQARLRWRGVIGLVSLPSVLQSCAGPVVLATVGGGVVALAGVQLALAIFTPVFALTFMFRTLSAPLTRPTRATLRELAAYVGPAALVALLALPLTTADRVLLARFDGTASVGFYGVAVAASAALASLAAAILQPLIVAFTRAAGAPERGAELFWRTVRMTVLIGIPPMALLALEAHPALAVWAGSVYASHSSGLLRILLIGCWFQVLGTVAIAQLLADRRVRSLALAILVQLVPMLVATVLLIDWLGATGAAIAFSARMGSETLFYLALVCRRANFAPSLGQILPSGGDVRSFTGVVARFWAARTSTGEEQ